MSELFGRGKKVLLRAPGEADRVPFIRAVQLSYRLHRPWVTPPETDTDFANYLSRIRESRHVGGLVCRIEDGAIAGVINLSEIVGGAFGNAYLGYYAMSGCEGLGYMSEGLSLMLRHAFLVMGLHRLEANVQPGNRASRKLVVNAGFSLEGFSPRYLKIDGDWRDHERYALLREEWAGQWSRPGSDD